MSLNRLFAPVAICGLFLLGPIAPLPARDAFEDLIIAAPQNNSLYSRLELPQSGMKGFDIDLLDSAAHVAQQDAQFVPSLSADQGLEMLGKGQVDAAAGIPLSLATEVYERGALLIPYRKEYVYAYVEQGALYRTSRDLSDARLAIPGYSSVLTFARTRGWDLTETRSYAEAFHLLREGKVDAVLAADDIAQTQMAIGSSIRFRRLPDQVFSTQIALAVRADFPHRQELASAIEAVSRMGHREHLENSWGLLPSAAAKPNFLLIAYAGLIFIAALLILTRTFPTRSRRHWAGINTHPAFPGRHH